MPGRWRSRGAHSASMPTPTRRWQSERAGLAGRGDPGQSETDLAVLAAAYAFGIARNHPFVDGNKRAAFGAMIVFLGLNDVDFRVAPESATAMILALAAGEVNEEGLTRWIKDNWPSEPGK